VATIREVKTREIGGLNV